MGNEETLGGFPVKQAVPVLVRKICYLLKISHLVENLLPSKKPFICLWYSFGSD